MKTFLADPMIMRVKEEEDWFWEQSKGSYYSFASTKEDKSEESDVDDEIRKTQKHVVRKKTKKSKKLYAKNTNIKDGKDDTNDDLDKLLNKCIQQNRKLAEKRQAELVDLNEQFEMAIDRLFCKMVMTRVDKEYVLKQLKEEPFKSMSKELGISDWNKNALECVNVWQTTIDALPEILPDLRQKAVLIWNREMDYVANHIDKFPIVKDVFQKFTSAEYRAIHELAYDSPYARVTEEVKYALFHVYQKTLFCGICFAQTNKVVKRSSIFCAECCCSYMCSAECHAKHRNICLSIQKNIELR